VVTFVGDRLEAAVEADSDGDKQRHGAAAGDRQERFLQHFHAETRTKLHS